jgi:predicted RecB family nuclease
MRDTILESEPILIGGGELGRCPTRIHHRRFTTDVRDADPVIERRIADGRRWEKTVLARLLEGSRAATISSVDDPFNPAAPVVIAGTVGTTDAEAITTHLLDIGVPMIIGGRISSAELLSVGAPDLLVHLPDGYAPIDVKHHKVVGRSGIPARSTPIGHLTDTDGMQCRFRTGRTNDLLQVAHYWTLLDHMGRANPGHHAGIIGAETGMQCLWVDLDAGSFTILDRYGAALAEAVAVVEAGRNHPERPLVPPVWRGECRGCPWAGVCRSELEDIDHVSLLPAVRAHDTHRLLAAGVTTTATVARLTPESLPPDMENAGEAILQARAREARSLLVRSGSDLTLPNASIEIDFDVETYHGVLYLAGLLVGGEGSAQFRPFSDWTGTPEGERRVLSDLFSFFDRLAEHGDFVVYHWTGYERTILEEASERHGLALTTASSVDDWFDRYACDLWAWVKQRFVSPNGYSLKVIAPLCGFDWRDEDPGGAQSEIWYSDLLAGDLSQRRRLLEYNEDDVAAQLAIRRWVRSRAPLHGT